MTTNKRYVVHVRDSNGGGSHIGIFQEDAPTINVACAMALNEAKGTYGYGSESTIPFAVEKEYDL